MRDIRTLARDFPFQGRIESILLRPARGQPAVRVHSAVAIEGRGLAGDRSASARAGGKRQVTLLQAEHLPVVASLLQRPHIDPALLRRNLVISGINLVAARSLFRDEPMHLQIGEDVLLEVTGPCEPCSKMQATLGEGAYNALRGHGGMTARVVRGGRVDVEQMVKCVAAC